MDTTPAACESLTLFGGPNDADFPDVYQHVPTRGVAWVLQRAAAVAVLYFSGCVLAEFAYCLAAEHALLRAVRAGALEATLPRATSQSVVAATRRRLISYQDVTRNLQLVVRQNGAPLRVKLQPQPGDRLAISIATPSREVIPRWLQALKFWGSGEQIFVSAERQVPGRGLITGENSAQFFGLRRNR